MYFYDLADYTNSCFFGKYRYLRGDSEDDAGTARETRNAWMKAVNQFRGIAYAPSCEECYNKLRDAFINYLNFLSDDQNITVYKKYWNMHIGFGTEVTGNAGDRLIGIQTVPCQKYTYDYTLNLPVDTDETITIDFGNGLWDIQILKDYIKYMNTITCLMQNLEKIAINLPEKSQITNFTQIV